MRIEHIALWTHQLEVMRDFYVSYFGGQASERYHSTHKAGFTSYFITFQSDARLELMQMPHIPFNKNDISQQSTGLIHMAFAVGTAADVEQLTHRLREDGYRIVIEPRENGHGFHESVVLDPDGNRIEISDFE